jgi:GR25 family glycosyltransferase involved in LPS biosynthesis
LGNTTNICLAEFEILKRFEPLPILERPFIPGEWGCSLSHYKILKDYRGNKPLVVFEDDIHICKDFRKRLEFLDKHFNFEWDIFYLGAYCALDDVIMYNPNIWQLRGVSYATHAMMFNPKSIDKILKLMLEYAPKVSAIDILHTWIRPMLKEFFFAPGCICQNELSGNINYADGNTPLWFKQLWTNRFGRHIFLETLEEF